jgi:hypothetical protein
MKVAVLLSGKFRNSYEEYKSIKKNLIDKYNADIFINYIYDNTIDINPIELINLYNPKNIQFTQLPNTVIDIVDMVSNYSKADESNTLSIFSMWYGIKKTNELKVNYELENNFKYDVVIRARFDTEILNKVELKLVQNSIFIPIGSDHRGGYNDLFAYGSSNTMDYYCSTFDNLIQYIIDGELIHPECLLRHHLDKHNFTFIRTNIPLKLRGRLVNEVDYSVKK